ncbi:MAG: acyl-CoA dehydrogenase family protein [Sinimarinibacterium sp.]|jgi:hypothetical protein
MNFEFSDEARAVQAEARRFFGERCPRPLVRHAVEGEQAAAAPLWRELGTLGYLAAGIDAEHGGQGLGLPERCLICEEAGRALAPLPLVAHWTAVTAIARHGSAAQRARWLPPLADGSIIATCTLAPAGAGPGVDSPCRLEHDLVTGTRQPVEAGAGAGLVVLQAHAPDGLCLVLVELAQAAVERTVVPMIDPSRPHARLTFRGARAERLGAAGAGAALADGLRDHAAILTGFCQLGGADAALAMARDYALERYAFGRVIGGYQAIKHKLVDVYVRNEIARGHCYYGAWSLATDAPETPAAAAGARLAATRAFSFAAQENVQVHGGLGFTWEADCHLYYRRARLLALVDAPLDAWRERLVDAMATPAPDAALAQVA